jgi:hypothetical protein
MATAKIRIELHKDAIKQFLQTDPGIGEDLTKRSEAVRDKANEKMPSPPHKADEHFSSHVWVGHDRQRASVRTTSQEAKRAEAEDHVLLSSLDAARSP